VVPPIGDGIKNPEGFENLQGLILYPYPVPYGTITHLSANHLDFHVLNSLKTYRISEQDNNKNVLYFGNNNESGTLKTIIVNLLS